MSNDKLDEILRFLDTCPGSMTLGEIARKFGVTVDDVDHATDVWAEQREKVDNVKPSRTGWEVLTAELSQQNGWLRVTGINHETTVEIDRKFSWHINPYGLKNETRFDFSHCEFAPGAEARLELMRKETAK